MTVRIFRSTDFGAREMTEDISKAIDTMTDCLVSGYGDQTVTITRVGSVATVTTPLPHGLSVLAKYNLAGADQAEYNGDFSVRVTGGSTLEFDVAGTPISPATGTIIGRLGGAGWTKPFTDTNVAAFKQGAGSNGFYLRIDDNATDYFRAVGYETMADANGGTQPFPTGVQAPTGLYGFKGNSASLVRDWVIVATESQFCMWVNAGGTAYNSPTFFYGDYDSDNPADNYNSLITCHSTASSASCPGVSVLDTTISTETLHRYIARGYAGIGSSVKANLLSGTGITPTYLGVGGFDYPDKIFNSLIMSPIYVGEKKIRRGKLKGIFNPLHDKALTHLDIFEGTGDYAGKTFLIIHAYNYANVILEISDTF